MYLYNILAIVVWFVMSAFATYAVSAAITQGDFWFFAFSRFRTWVWKKVGVPYVETMAGKADAQQLQTLVLLPENQRGNYPVHWLYKVVSCPKCASLYIAIIPTAFMAYLFGLAWYETGLILFALAGASRWLYTFE